MNSLLLIPVSSELLFSDCGSASWVDAKMGLIHFILFCVGKEKVQEKDCKEIADWKMWGTWSAGRALWEASTSVLYLSVIFINMYSYCDLPFH